MEESKTTLIEALARAKLKFDSVTRSETADTGKYKYKYATLDSMIEATQGALSAEGIIVYHTMRLDGETKFAMIACHVRGHGDEIIAEVAMPYPVADGRMNPAQALGSLLPYGRRYSYGAALGIAIEDDDDARATEAPAKRPVVPCPPASPSPAKGSEEVPLSTILKDATEAGYLTEAQRKAYFDEGAALRKLDKADPLTGLRAKVADAIEQGKITKENPELY